MTCDKIRAQLTAYLDGELADDRGCVVRGHLRSCAACRQLASDEAALRDGLRALPTLDPPVSLWAGVQQRLAAEEVADAQRPAWRRMVARWMPRLPQLALGGAVVAAAIALLAIRAQRDVATTPEVSTSRQIDSTASAPARALLAPEPAPAAEGADTDVSDVIANAPATVTGEYAAVARELLPLAEEARERWSVEQQHDFDARLAELQHQIAAAPSERERHRGYRALIRYLQRAAIRDDVALASLEGMR